MTTIGNKKKETIYRFNILLMIDKDLKLTKPNITIKCDGIEQAKSNFLSSSNMK
jgi:hypothetical protein